MFKSQDLLGTTLHCWYPWQCHPQSHPEPDTAVRLTQQLGSTTVFLTSQKQFLHHLSLWLSWNILFILWFVQSTVSRTLALPAQTRWVIPAQWGTHGLPLKHDFKIALMMRKAKHKLWSEHLSDLYSLCKGRQCFWLPEGKCTGLSKTQNKDLQKICS